MDQKSNLRLRQARERYAAAVERAELARAAAAPAIERRSHRRAAMLRLAVIAAVVAAAVLIGIGWSMRVAADSLAGDLDDQRAAQTAAQQAIVTMLTADPADAGSYVPSVLTVTTGDQQIRIKGAGQELEALVAAQAAPATGQVLSSGVAAADGSGITVLVIAQTTTPELVGGAAGQNRVGVAMTMERVGDQWLVAQTKAVS